MERLQDNPLMRLPIDSVFISRFLIQPLCYTQSATFSGILENNHVRYLCILNGGFFNGEEVVRNKCRDRRTLSIPITTETIILSRNDHLSFAIYNRGFDHEEFFVQDLFTLNIWLRALQQHIVDIRCWEQTIEHLPSIRRYSHQPLATSASSVNLTKQPTLRMKARSLDNIHQTNLDSEPILTNKFNPYNTLNYTSDHHATMDDDDDDDDNASVIHVQF